MRLEVMRMKQTRVIHVRLGEKCICCQGARTEGIRIFDSFICLKCEEGIVDVESNEEPYGHFITALRGISPSVNEN
ncbi:sigma factor G inhibitor Gin [Alkalihalophilus marmarensis]